MNLLDLQTIYDLLENNLEIDNGRIIGARFFEKEEKNKDHVYITPYLSKNNNIKTAKYFLEKVFYPNSNNDVVFTNIITKKNKINKKIINKIRNIEEINIDKKSTIFTLKNNLTVEWFYVHIYISKTLNDQEIELAKKLFDKNIHPSNDPSNDRLYLIINKNIIFK